MWYGTCFVQFDTNLSPIPWTSTVKKLVFASYHTMLSQKSIILIRHMSNRVLRIFLATVALPLVYLCSGLAAVALPLTFKFVGKFLLSKTSEINVSRSYVKVPINSTEQLLSKSYSFKD